MINLTFKDGRKLDVVYPIKLTDSSGNIVYCQRADGYWSKCKYDKNDLQTFFQDSNGYWEKKEWNSNGKITFFKTSEGVKRGTSKHDVVEMTMEEICKSIGKNVKVIK